MCLCLCYIGNISVVKHDTYYVVQVEYYIFMAAAICRLLYYITIHDISYTIGRLVYIIKRRIYNNILLCDNNK